ncbi:PIN domain-containing protein [Granulibacter bethesdensis]|uniref:Uncharacterized protein n=1 Tax=Granulibacter bethesdensis (strain ATCC BAA-1260 / CGDNIH1) TaxID=391165 RepID=Q0BRQ9_GRABC|nr:PIN domain-containing protein [Granulibacter bethesdensis]ABI62493.1 Hypothetical protein GbCGDNIH1_1595 [Granulibacter bethesdensis CGDNIH1]APG30699.1 Hypothetical protein GbCGDNIH2_1595 [Granulibacter bethesdensis]APH52335.1 Hypothetical protein GbCGDNIH5_1595 [Granulibacter bethesdensis]APH65029.1 Hypothetical protein GbCGDNIH1I4_1595 [Granulibacter bethesdensis]
MFANRFTARLDACTLTGALKRNLLLSLAEEGFFRPCWSQDILDETKRAIAGIIAGHAPELTTTEAEDRTQRACNSIIHAFPEAMVMEYGHLAPHNHQLPDPADAHAIAAASITPSTSIICNV